MRKHTFAKKGTMDQQGPPFGVAVAYCLFVSSFFVGSLYACVPSRVRRLDRNDPRQIRWRSGATVIACAVASILYPSVYHGPLPFISSGNHSIFEQVKADAEACVTVLLHTSILYFGPLLRNAFFVDAIRNDDRIGASGLAKLREFLHTYYCIFIDPTFSSLRKGGGEAWCTWRNLVVAPIAEEFVFRGCIVSALATSRAGYAASDSFRLTTTQTIVVAPLFFGVAHFHHALTCLRRGQPFSAVVFQTLFQFTYTSVFGSYATFLFLKTHSLVAAVLCHSYCNAMGLPDLTFMRSESFPLYKRRWVLACAHVAGLLCFVSMIDKFYSK